MTEIKCKEDKIHKLIKNINSLIFFGFLDFDFLIFEILFDKDIADMNRDIDKDRNPSSKN